MAKARAFEATAEELNLANPVGFSDLCLFSMPVQTFKALSDEAARRGMTVGQLVEKAFKDVLTPTQHEGK